LSRKAVRPHILFFEEIMTDQKDLEQNTNNNTDAVGETVPSGPRKPRRTPKKTAAEPEGGPKDGEAAKAAGKPKTRRGIVKSAPGDAVGIPAEVTGTSPAPDGEAGIPDLLENEDRTGKKNVRAKSSGRRRSSAKGKSADSSGADADSRAVAQAGEDIPGGRDVGELFAATDDAPTPGIRGARREARTQATRKRGVGKQASPVSSRGKKAVAPDDEIMMERDLSPGIASGGLSDERSFVPYESGGDAEGYLDRAESSVASMFADGGSVARESPSDGKSGSGKKGRSRSGRGRKAADAPSGNFSVSGMASEMEGAPIPAAETDFFAPSSDRDESAFFADHDDAPVAVVSPFLADFPVMFDELAVPEFPPAVEPSIAAEPPVADALLLSAEPPAVAEFSPAADVSAQFDADDGEEDGFSSLSPEMEQEDFPTDFGDIRTEDFFASSAGDGDAAPEAGEKRRHSRSRRGRGRKKFAAQQAAAATTAEAAEKNTAADSFEDAENRPSRVDDAGRGVDFAAAEEDPLALRDDDYGYAYEDEDEDVSGRVVEAEQKGAGRVARRKMFVSVLTDEQVEVVITEEGLVQEYYVEMLHQAKTKGNIYKGIVNNVDPNLQAAFVSYGAAKNGFLQIDEVHPEYYVAPHDVVKGRKYPPIQKVLKPGQELLVQVVKEPAGTKGAFLSTYLSMPGRFLVLTPGREQIGVSRKVEDETERARLREMLEGLNPGPGLGVIVRTVSMGASKTNLQRDLQFLKRTWKEVRTRGTIEKAPCLVYQEMDLTARAVRDYLTDAIGEIWMDDTATAASVTEIAEALFPRKQNLVRVHKDSASSLFERFNIQPQLDQIHSREVFLPSGGRLVIDPTEALTAIDINSGRSGGKNNFEDMAYRTNMEAAKMIPLQLRLRDIGGQIVADFIEMRDKNHWREVEKVLRAGMKVDRARYDVGKIGPFGMIEIVRQRLGSSAISVSTEPCPCCNGTGVRRNMEWQSQHALRDILRSLRTAQTRKEAVLVYPVEHSLALHLLNNKRQRLMDMEQQFGVRLEIQVKPSDSL
jgi:ribonuclease E